MNNFFDTVLLLYNFVQSVDVTHANSGTLGPLVLFLLMF